MRVLINYANHNYAKAQRINSLTGKWIAGFNKIIEYSPGDIDDVFAKEHSYVLSIERGNGLWLWKPYFIYRTLCELSDGDFLFYCDSGAYFIRSIKAIERISHNQGIWISHFPTITCNWIKPDLFQLMDCDNEATKTSRMIHSAFIGLVKCELSMRFAKDWLDCCCDIRMLDSVNRNYASTDPRFIEHREDQSVLTLLLKRYYSELTTHHDPTQFSRYPEEYWRNRCTGTRSHLYDLTPSPIFYRPIIVLHRSNVDCRVCVKRFLEATILKKRLD